MNPINVDTPATNTSFLNVENPTNVDKPLTYKLFADPIPILETPATLNCSVNKVSPVTVVIPANVVTPDITSKPSLKVDNPIKVDIPETSKLLIVEIPVTFNCSTTSETGLYDPTLILLA